jgi:hypothetical protein
VDGNDEQAQLAGTLLALRVVMAALVRTHPEPERLLHEIKSTMDTQGELDKRLPGPQEAAFDARLHEFTSLLYARVSR